jgi:Fur family ferric uptake transcriptional regulator
MQRNTQQRQVILEELKKLTSHPTAAVLYAIVRQRLPRISLGTVYRNLELLACNGVIKKIETSGKQSRFDAECMKHDHVRCIECGKVDDIGGVSDESSNRRFLHHNGYEVLGSRVEYFGKCPDCRDEKNLFVNELKNQGK